MVVAGEGSAGMNKRKKRLPPKECVDPMPGETRAMYQKRVSVLFPPGMSKGADTPFNNVLRNNNPVNIAAAMPIKYSINTIFWPPTGKKAATNTA